MIGLYRLAPAVKPLSGIDRRGVACEFLRSSRGTSFQQVQTLNANRLTSQLFKVDRTMAFST
jgi:hypothetical protein